MKKTLLLLLNFLLLPVIGQETAIVYLSGKDKDNTVEWEFLCTNGRNSNQWSRIAVPSNWELQGFGSYLYGNINMDANEKGLYRHSFRIPPDWKKKRIFIVFEGSMTDTEVKINGILAGPVHQGAFYRFKYDITDLVNLKKENLLEVTVSKESANESINRAERISDYWVFGGIFRPVYLEAVPGQYIDHMAIDAKADGNFSMDVFTEGKGPATKVKCQILTTGGKPFGEAVTATLDGSGKTTLRGKFSDPETWNPEFPNLYRAEVSLEAAKGTVHRINQKFGFRTVEVRQGDGIYVNGSKVMFRGVCRHTFWPSSGRTSSKALAVADVNLMKDMNMNAVRMSHYPPDQYFLDVCDSLGMFVLDELAGWQKAYDTPTAKRLVREMVIRDVNHPSIVLWDNGNEGGFNKDVRSDYEIYDPQKRTVIEPWSIINGTNTKHYPGYEYVRNALEKENEIYFPTEFLHGLFDGGLGAGLDDYWNLMTSKPLSAGGFLWVFADEGVERKDLNDSIDACGNRGPDGILGPYHEKEGSFYTIKEIWSPVHFGDSQLDAGFDGRLSVSNRFIYTNLNQCRYSFELVGYEGRFPDLKTRNYKGNIQPPDVPPEGSGQISLDLPGDWQSYDVLYITAIDPYGRNINKWSWNINDPADLIPGFKVSAEDKISVSDDDSLLTISTGPARIIFNKKNGLMEDVTYNNKNVPFNNGVRFTGFKTTFAGMNHFYDGDTYIIELNYDNGCRARWTVLPGGLLRLDYSYNITGTADYAGITFSFPEKMVTGATLMADGPYHVWKNRLKGTLFGVYEKKYNNTVTGESWDYPEFKGYYSNFYAVKLESPEMPVTIMSATRGLFLHLFTPGLAKYSTTGVRGEVNPAFPDGDISVLHAISPIGTKFSKARDEGPQGSSNIFNTVGKGVPLQGTIYIRFGE